MDVHKNVVKKVNDSRALHAGSASASAIRDKLHAAPPAAAIESRLAARDPSIRGASTARLFLLGMENRRPLVRFAADGEGRDGQNGEGKRKEGRSIR